MAKRKRMYFDPVNEKFQRFEDGSVRLPTKVLDAETKKVRNPIPMKKK
jgi:hypothetical protein